MARLSVILPSYNGELYLRQSIESILAQTFEDWELILVDDCSFDSTLQIMNYYADRDSRITVIHNKVNQKLPQSLNIGFEKACGEYLAWTSDDNMYLPDALQLMIGYLDKHEDSCMVRADMQIIDENGNFVENTERYDNYNMYLRNCLGACFMYRRTVKDEIGNYDIDAFGVEDYDYWLRILRRYGKIDSLDKILYQYRRHGKSLSETKKIYILNQLSKLRKQNLDIIFEKYNDDKAKLCQIYYEMLQSDQLDGKRRELFKKCVPELEGDVSCTDSDKFIIFGAGVYGKKAADILGNRASFYMDNDEKKVGTVIGGVKVLSFNEALKLIPQYKIMISINQNYVYELIKQLRKSGVYSYSVYWSYIREIP